MLAQSFMTADELRISDVEHAALVGALASFERGEIPNEHFQMDNWKCGSVMCICGWANHLSRGAAFPEVTRERFHPMDGIRVTSDLSARLPRPLLELFGVDISDELEPSAWRKYERLEPAQAALAIRNYLTAGETRWAEVLA